MALELEHAIFGNGWGLKSPHFDDTFYWLSGRLYHWLGGLGAQLTSFEWRHPRAGERRNIVGLTFVPFLSTRRWLLVEISWRMVDMPPHDLDEANRQIAELRRRLSEV